MSFQSSTQQFTCAGVAGKLAFILGNELIQSYILDSDGTTQTYGYAFTQRSGGDLQTSNTAQVGGTGVFAGILVMPETATGGTLTPTMNVADNVTGSLCTQGFPFVALPNASAIGDLVTYNTSTGAIADTFAPIAAFTAAQSTTTLTVSAITAGNIGIGSVIRNASNEILGTVIALGTGTGGTGTYTLNTSATVSSAAMTANSQASASTQKLIPGAVVYSFPLGAAGTGVIKLGND